MSSGRRVFVERPFRVRTLVAALAATILNGCSGADSGDEPSGAGGGPADRESGGAMQSEGQTGPAFEAAVERVSGYYQVTHHTSNSDGCDTEGPSLLDGPGDGFFYLDYIVDPGLADDRQTFAELGSCSGFEPAGSPDVSSCPAKLALARAGETRSYNFSAAFQRVTGSTLVGANSSLLLLGEPAPPERCRTAAVYSELSPLADNQVRLEERAYETTDLSGLDCITTERVLAAAAAADEPCSRYTVIVGRRIQALP